MPRENPIIGSGRRGFGFEQKGFQERNLGLLLETLSKKEVQKSIEALSKFDKDEWIAMAATATTLNNFISLGGASTLISSVKETIKLQIDSLISPLKNELNELINTLLKPILPLLTDIVNTLTPIIQWIADRVQDILDFVGEETFDAGGFEFETYAGYTGRTGGSYLQYLDYLANQMRIYLTTITGGSGSGSGRTGGPQEDF